MLETRLGRLVRPARRALSVAVITAAAFAGGAAHAEEMTISVAAGGTGDADMYRIDAIKMAADILSRQEAIKGHELKITVEGKASTDWDQFKQSVTLAGQAGSAPNIVVTGHEDIASWAQSGLIVPVEDYLDLDSWPISDIYPNLLKIASFNGKIYGLPQDAESRPLFVWIPHLKKIGYSDADIAALPGRIEKGDYTLYDMLNDAKKMQDAGLVQPGYGFYPRVSNGPDYWQFYVAFGGKMQDEKTGRLELDKAALEKMYQFFADAVKMGVTRKNHIGTPWDQWYTEVATGKAGFWDGGTWHYARYTGKEGLKDFFGTLMFSLIPAGEKGGVANTLTHPLVYLVTKQKDEHLQEVAAQLVAIASEPRINALHAIKSAHLGISRSEAHIGFYADDRWTREATERLLPHAIAMPNNTHFGTYWDVMWKGLQSAWQGQSSPKDAVNAVASELQGSLGDAIIIN
jgi:inositol-phosphate transport system substrate-binding protein